MWSQAREIRVSQSKNLFNTYNVFYLLYFTCTQAGWSLFIISSIHKMTDKGSRVAAQFSLGL